jgi:predicted transcriptional regulator YdeE
VKHATRIERLEELILIGAPIYGNPEEINFSRVWEYFGKVADDVGISRIGRDLYGLQIYSPWFPQRLEMTYIASIEMGDLVEVPLRMVVKTIPASLYAVQKVIGGINKIDETIMDLYQDYIPKNHYSVAMPIDFEKYCNVQSHESDPDDIEFWVPIKNA